jgi:hypothetical protein
MDWAGNKDFRKLGKLSHIFWGKLGAGKYFEPSTPPANLVGTLHKNCA